MNFLVINAGFPVMQLLVLGWLAALVVGLYLSLAGRGRRRIGGLLLLAAFAAMAAVNYDRDRNVDLNPLFSETELVGSWSGQLQLQKSGKFVRADQAGSWTRVADFQLQLVPLKGKPESYRVISYREKLALIDDFRDPDEWNGSFRYTKQ
jgi:hypothetical protein